MRYQTVRVSVVLGIVFFISLSVSAFAQRSADSTLSIVPPLITLNGVLKDRDGHPFAGVIGATFSLYREQEGGTPLWMENQNVQIGEQGQYALLLGATQARGLPMELFASAEPRWLGVRPHLTGEEERPRVLLVSVPYALKAADADTIGGKPASAFVLAADKTDSQSQISMVSQPGGNGPTISALSSASAPLNVTGFEFNAPLYTNTRIDLGATGGHAQGALTFAASPAGTSVDGAGIGFQANANNSGLLTFGTRNLGTFAERMRITSDGQVGIGTDNPQGAKLAVLGHSLNGPWYTNTRINLGATGGLALGALTFAAAPTNGTIVDGAGIGYQAPDLNNGLLTFATLGSGVPAERMRITSNGNVGIGTSTPTAKLEIVGTAKATALDGDGSSVTNINAANLTTGTLNNSRTTATSSNTASAIVARDASGNFSANNITAAAFAGNGSGLTNVNAASLGGQPASSFQTRGITYLAGCDTCSVLTNADDQRTIYFNVVGPMTINSVTCFTDVGTTSVNIQRDTGVGSPADVLGSSLACSTTGATTIVFAPGQSTLNLNDKLDFLVVTADLVAKRVTLSIKATVN